MQKFDTPAPISAVLDIPAGRVQFIAADRTDTAVEVRPANPAKNKILGDHGSVEVTVQLPAGSRVEAKGAAVELRGVGRLGDVVFESAQGPVKLDEAASAHLTLLAGDITVGRDVEDGGDGGGGGELLHGASPSWGRTHSRARRFR